MNRRYKKSKSLRRVSVAEGRNSLLAVCYASAQNRIKIHECEFLYLANCHRTKGPLQKNQQVRQAARAPLKTEFFRGARQTCLITRLVVSQVLQFLARGCEITVFSAISVSVEPKVRHQIL
jgi:hypothetical protein